MTPPGGSIATRFPACLLGRCDHLGVPDSASNDCDENRTVVIAGLVCGVSIALGS